MLVLTGVFDKQTFLPDEPVTIPQNKRAVVMIQDETSQSILTYKEFAAKARIIRSKIEKETGKVDVLSLIREGRK